MTLFNLVLYFALRDGIYLLYVAFVISTAFALGADQGMAQEFLWPEASGWTAIANFFGCSYSIGTFVYFSRRMLGTKKVLPRFDKLLRLLAWGLFLSPVGFVIAPFAVALPAVLIYLGTFLLVMAGTVYCLAVDRQRSAVFYAAAFAAFLVAALLTSSCALALSKAQWSPPMEYRLARRWKWY
ncbi:MAG: 7TM-DISM domain-containing protein [Rhodocyclaceae bacterium]|nr:7TM-DISM domain-containing protein [Rhodocyclaceae bacterium]